MRYQKIQAARLRMTFDKNALKIRVIRVIRGETLVRGRDTMRLLIATTNPGKVKEFQTLLSGLNLELVGLNDIGLTTEVEETGMTFAENAELKARAYAKTSGLLTLADDSGIEVEAMGGRPGVYSARYASSNEERIQKMLAEIKDVPDENRSARFQCAITLAWPDGRFETVSGTCEGFVAHEPHGNGGFGFDPIFYFPEYGQTMAELPIEVKNQISHRGKAAMKAKKILLSEVI
jgi:XTP/dITP diphosphohydrolase